MFTDERRQELSIHPALAPSVPQFPDFIGIAWR